MLKWLIKLVADHYALALMLSALGYAGLFARPTIDRAWAWFWSTDHTMTLSPLLTLLVASAAVIVTALIGVGWSRLRNYRDQGADLNTRLASETKSLYDERRRVLALEDTLLRREGTILSMEKTVSRLSEAAQKANDWAAVAAVHRLETARSMAKYYVHTVPPNYAACAHCFSAKAISLLQPHTEKAGVWHCRKCNADIDRVGPEARAEERNEQLREMSRRQSQLEQNDY